MPTEMVILPAQPDDREAVVQLLHAEKLPVEDLPEDLDHFFLARVNGQLAGAIGLELYGRTGLLRSLVVHPSFRNSGVAGKLVQRLEEEASMLGLTQLYLLTESAPDYFARKGFRRTERGAVPEELKASSEFTHTCPLSAAVFKKELEPA